jgi:hypothetical protein
MDTKRSKSLRAPFVERRRLLSVIKIPPKDPRDVGAKSKQLSISLLEWMWKRVDEVAEAEGYTRNELMREVVRSFVNEWDSERGGKKPAEPEESIRKNR